MTRTQKRTHAVHGTAQSCQADSWGLSKQQLARLREIQRFYGVSVELSRLTLLGSLANVGVAHYSAFMDGVRNVEARFVSAEAIH